MPSPELWQYAALGLGGALVSCLVWFAIRMVNQLDRIETLFTDGLHKLDIRITKIEAKYEATQKIITPMGD